MPETKTTNGARACRKAKEAVKAVKLPFDRRGTTPTLENARSGHVKFKSSSTSEKQFGSH